MPELSVHATTLAGLFRIDLAVHADPRGSFRESFQAEKMRALGLPEFHPVQWNISVNAKAGTVRGIHAEPWDKYIHCIHGRAFAAIVDMRKDSATFGKHETFTLDQGQALFVPQGMGNSYQALEDNTIYGYLVNAHWKPGITYPAVHYADPDLAIAWPLPVSSELVSEKDQQNKNWREVFPV